MPRNPSVTTSRNWAATFYVAPDFVFDTAKIRYFIAGEEKCPETGRTHYQAFIVFKNKQSMKAVKRIVDDNTVHLEPAKASALANIKYCSKDGNIYREEGKRPKGQGARSDLVAFRDHFKSGGTTRAAIEDDGKLAMVARYPRLANTLELMYSVERSEPTELHIFWGVPGSGKSHKAFEEAKELGDVYFKPQGPWWDGYDSQPSVIFEDFRGETPLAQFLRLADRYPLRVAVKGGFKQFNSKRLYVTSNLDIDDWWNSEQKGYDVSMEAFRRRITIKIHFPSRYVPQ